MKKENSAFSLLELSVTLIIIGLIVTSILAGQEFIRSAEARSIINQVTQYNLAIQTFKSKYNALPGDFRTASSSLLSSGFKVLPAAGINGYPYGNGDGLVGATDGKWSQEHVLVWTHLSIADMIETGGNYYGFYWGHFNGGNANNGILPSGNIPLLKNRRGGLIIYATSDGYNSYHLGIDKDISAYYSGTSVSKYLNPFKPEVASDIDLKIDDGAPSTGLINAVTALDTLSSATTADTTTCHSDAIAPYVYNLTNNPGYVCQLKIKTAF